MSCWSRVRVRVRVRVTVTVRVRVRVRSVLVSPRKMSCWSRWISTKRAPRKEWMRLLL